MTEPAKTVEQHFAAIIAEVRCAERERIAAILNHAHAAGRRTLAEHMALTTTTPVDEAIAVLSVAAKSQPPELSLVAPSTNADGDAITKGK